MVTVLPCTTVQLYVKNIITGPQETVSLLFSFESLFPFDFVLGNIEILGKRKLLFPSEPVIKGIHIKMLYMKPVDFLQISTVYR